jgi:LPS export ABC transporter protein LptC
MIYRIIAALALIAIILGSLLHRGGQRTTVPALAVSQEIPQDPEGYAARHARLIQTGPDGQPLYTVDAEAMQQRPDEGTVELEQVKVGFRDDGGNLWKAWGNHGSLGQDTGQVDLVGDVQVEGLLPGTQDEAHMATETLHVDTRAQIVHTTESVTMITSNRHSQLRSHGLYVNLKNGHVRLESAVHGTYVP